MESSSGTSTRGRAATIDPRGPRRGVALVIAAPSGAGKSTLCRRILDAEPDAALSVSVTTRAPRPGERDGIDYHFVDQAHFDKMADNRAFLEWARVFGRSYGTRHDEVESRLGAGRDVLLDIDWQGWRQIREQLPEAVGVFILPPDLASLEARLKRRAQDDWAEIARRMAAARSEMRHFGEFRHVLVNDDLDRCVEEVLAILRAARTERHRWPDLPRFVESLVAGECA